MKSRNHCPMLILLVAIGIPWVSAKSISETAEQKQTQQSVISSEFKDGKYASYQIDGFATPSKLAAQRSHTPAGEDERNFAVFTGITVIAIIFGLSQIILNRN